MNRDSHIALTTLYFRRCDQRCAALALGEVKAPTAVAGYDREPGRLYLEKEEMEINVDFFFFKNPHS
jgi:hypothetical protein